MEIVLTTLQQALLVQAAVVAQTPLAQARQLMLVVMAEPVLHLASLAAALLTLAAVVAEAKEQMEARAALVVAETAVLDQIQTDRQRLPILVAVVAAGVTILLEQTAVTAAPVS